MAFEEKRTSTRTLTLLDYKLAFVALASGVGAAGVALLLETGVHAATPRVTSAYRRTNATKRFFSEQRFCREYTGVSACFSTN